MIIFLRHSYKEDIGTEDCEFGGYSNARHIQWRIPRYVLIGEAISWEFFYLDREPGHYEILTSTEVDRKLSLILNKGQSRYVRLNIALDFFVGHVYPELVENEVGEKEIQDCRYTMQNK